MKLLKGKYYSMQGSQLTLNNYI